MTTDDAQTPQTMTPQPQAALGHLIVLRTTLVAVIHNVDAAIALLSGSQEPGATQKCEHPADQLEQLNGGIGEPLRVRCKLCGEEFEKEADW